MAVGKHEHDSGMRGVGETHLLLYIPVRKYIFQRNIELAQVILAESIVVPADTLEQRDANNGHFKRHVPFRIQRLEYRRCRLPSVSKRDYQVLNYCQPTNPSIGTIVRRASPSSLAIEVSRNAYRITCPPSVFGGEIPPLFMRVEVSFRKAVGATSQLDLPARPTV